MLVTASFTCGANQGSHSLDLEPKKMGFYWYEEKELESEVEEEKQTKIPIVISGPKERQQDGKTYEEMWVMEVDAFAELLENRQKLAIQFPTPENVFLYQEAQDVAKRKSGAFAGVMGMVAQLHPEFSSENIYPANVPGQKVYVSERRNDDDSFFNENNEHYALIVFTSVGCQYCDAQKPIIDLFHNMYGWDIRYLDISKYGEIANKYSVTMAPSILVISKKDSDAMPVSSGLITLPELKRRVSRTIRFMSGDNNPEQWYRNERISDPLKFIDG